MGDGKPKRDLTEARFLVGGLYHYRQRYGGDVYLSNWHVNDVEFVAGKLEDAHAAGRAERDAEGRALGHAGYQAGDAAGYDRAMSEVRAMVEAQVEESNRLSLENPDFRLQHEERADDFEALLAQLPPAPKADSKPRTEKDADA